jgi:hypothetical protein
MVILSPLVIQDLIKAKYTKRWRGKDGKWHYEYSMPGKAMGKDAFTPAMLSKMYAEYSKLKTIDPESPTYQKMTVKLDSMSDKQLQQLVDAKIPFLAGLARNRLMRRDKAVNNWAKDIVPYVQKYIDQGWPKEQAIELAMDDYGKILKEMAEQKTPRSQAAKKKMAEEVYSEVRRSSIREIKPGQGMPKNHPALRQAREHDKRRMAFKIVDKTPKGYGPKG